LKSLRGLADFDSTMRRFESSRPSQYFAPEWLESVKVRADPAMLAALRGGHRGTGREK
jgi:hypothetical protein